MCIDDLIELMADASFFNLEVYDLNSEKTVYRGPADDIQDKYRYVEISSIDCPARDSLCINIEYEED